MARGEPARAAVELRGAIYSPTDGYTRTNLELGRVLLALGKPREAVAILQPALRGPVDASNLYVTRTEIHELLAHAFEAAGQRDSATTHYRKVAGAWRDADRTFRARAAAAAKKAAMR
jgi:predicted Zn-dependent protease